MSSPFPNDADALRAEIRYLRRMLALPYDPRALAEVEALIKELEARIKRLENGGRG
jgi:hypothetical protein